MQFIQELADQVRSAWKREHFNPEKFSAIAVQLLERLAPYRHLTAAEILRWLFTVEELPAQTNLAQSFGEPGIQLFSGEGFYIEALFWIDGTTAIHQHAFSGAFQVLAGSSLHSTYEFRRQRVVNDRLELGQLDWLQSELLSTGATRVIHAGRPMIHSLFHLDRPSVTLVVRTFHDSDAGLQYGYLKPGVAFYPQARSPWTTRCIQALGMLRRTDEPEFRRAARALLADCDFSTCHAILMSLSTTDEEELIPLLVVLRERDAELADTFEAMLYDLKRGQDIIGARATVKEAEHRFFLAVLLNVPNRQTALDVIRARFDEPEPHRRIGRWLAELSDSSTAAARLSIEFTAERRAALETHLIAPSSTSNEALDYLREFSALDPLFE